MHTHLELALVTDRCEEALCSTGDILLAVAAHFKAFLELFQASTAAELLDVVPKTYTVLS